MNWLLRAVKWARNPPSARSVRLTLAVLAVVALIVGLEYAGWWPEWATMNEGRAVRLPR